MARYDRGVFVIDRGPASTDSQNSPFYGDVNMIAIYYLLHAWSNYEDRPALFGAQRVILKRGQLITSSAQIENFTKLSRPVVRRVLRILQEFGFIDQQKRQHGTLITVLNYNNNHDFIFGKDQQKDQRRDNAETTQDQQKDQRETNVDTRIKEERKEETKEGKLRFADAPPAASDDKVVLPDTNPPKVPAVIDTASETRNKERRLAAQYAKVKTARVYDAYRAAYYTAYAIEPPDNGKIRAQVSRLIDLVGEDDAAEVARWYIEKERGKNGWLIEKRHPFGELVSSYQTYWGNYKARRRITADEAKSFERKESNRVSMHRYMQKSAKHEEGTAL